MREDIKIMNQNFSIKTLFIALCCLLSSQFSAAQSNRLYTTQQGLFTSDITSLCIDQQGLAWIAGKTKIGYFDGAEFHYIPNLDPKTQRPIFQRANAIKEDKDNCYWVMTNRGLMYFDSRKLTYQYIKVSESEADDMGYSVMQMLDIPGEKNIKLVVTDGFGVYLFDINKKETQKERTQKLQNAVQDGFITSAIVDNKGRIWLSCIRKELVCIDSKTLEKISFRMTPEAEAMVAETRINEMEEVLPRNAIYMASNSGILKYDDKEQILKVVSNTKGKNFQALLYTQSDELFVGTDSYGVYKIDKEDNAYKHEVTDLLFDLSLCKVRDMVQDKDGNIIIALLQKGVLVMPRRNDEFRYHPISANGNVRNTSCITSLTIDSKKNYWIATDGAGVFMTDGMHMISAHEVNNGLRSLLAQAIVVDKHDDVWVGTYGGGVQKYKNGSFTTPKYLDRLNDMLIKSMAYDSKSDIIYVATNGSGVFRIDICKELCEKVQYSDKQGAWLSFVNIDDEQTLWVGEVEKIYFYNSRTGIRGEVRQEGTGAMPTCMTYYGKGADRRVFIGTSEGLIVYNPNNAKTERYFDEEPIASFNQTEEDVWIATSDNIYAFDKKTMKAERYTSFGGFYVGEFHQESTLNNKAGNILFGCDNGIICFDPEAIRKKRTLSNRILFTSLHVDKNMVNYSDSTDYLDNYILYAKQIRIPHNENSFRISFSVPHLSSPRQVHYEYMLEGYDNDWTPCSTTQSAYYSTLPSGNYTLHVKAYLEGDASSAIENTIQVHVDAPWYDTTCAHIIYILILLGAIYITWRVVRNRREQKMALQEALHNEEIKEAKLRLFTSIAHELRTPLTMIVSPLQHLITAFDTPDNQKNAENENIMASLNVMKHNCNRLLGIVKQITDMRKIDAGQFKLHFQEVDICEYIHGIANSFIGVATVKRINFSVEDSEKSIYAWIDPTHFEKIIINILSNAFKFCPEGNRITVRNRIINNRLEISIYNGGSHIDEADLSHIYERFYQTNSGKRHLGSGIGLNLAYELVNLHHATINAHNIEPDGVEFVITLPLGCSHLTAEEQIIDNEEANNKDSIDVNIKEIATETETEEGTAEGEEHRDMPSLLIVDDNKDILEYLKTELQQDYKITLAFSGNSAWNMVLQNRPDVILTDMKMPDGDGIELCRRIKANPELDHIPIIMLTGEGDERIQIESLKLNVDHYVQKPFNIIILKGLIRQVLRVRESMKKHIQRTDISTDYERIEMDSAEDRLFGRINEALQTHIDDSEFGVQELADEVGISRVHLNRKMKEKYGLSPNVFIRSFRLKQAAYLLVHNKVNVSEVAYRVGFSTHSYFSSSFREYFGMSPKEFVACHAEGINDEALKKLLE